MQLDDDCSYRAGLINLEYWGAVWYLDSALPPLGRPLLCLCNGSRFSLDDAAGLLIAEPSAVSPLLSSVIGTCTSTVPALKYCCRKTPSAALNAVLLFSVTYEAHWTRNERPHAVPPGPTRQHA
eukprot:scaffold2088_cov399-Prasinococcus_capsulatus_cf.AAC.16